MYVCTVVLFAVVAKHASLNSDVGEDEAGREAVN